MGIRHLQTYMLKSVPNGKRFINIEQEVDEYRRRNNDRDPLIIIDLIALQGQFNQTNHEIMLGGRYNVCVESATRMLKKLKSLDVELIFIADGPLQDSKVSTTLDRREESYQACVRILKAISSGRNLGGYLDDLDIKFITPFKKILLEIANQFGDVYLGNLNECDIELAELATRKNAMAIISNDTDFLIFEGNWQLWLSNEMNFEKLTTVELNRVALRQYLSLTPKQMPLFATLGGTDILKFDYVKNYHYKITPRSADKFKQIAQVIKRVTQSSGMITEKCIDELVQAICNQTPGLSRVEIRELFVESLNSYDYTKMNTKYETELLKEVGKDLNRFNYVILANRPYIVQLYYFDLSDNEFLSFYDLVIPLVRAVMGILLKHLNDKNVTRNFYSKKEHLVRYKKIVEKATYPDINVPPLKELLFTPFGKKSSLDDIRMELIAWCISPNMKSSVVKTLPKESLIASLTLFYLMEKQQITLEEADCVLLANHCPATIRDSLNLKDMNQINIRDAKISFLYTEGEKYVRNCISAVGLQDFCALLSFDGLYFHCLRKGIGKFTADYKKDELKKLDNIRVYKNLEK